LLKDESKVVLHNKRLEELFFFITISINCSNIYERKVEEKIKGKCRNKSSRYELVEIKVCHSEKTAV